MIVSPVQQTSGGSRLPRDLSHSRSSVAGVFLLNTRVDRAPNRFVIEKPLWLFTTGLRDLRIEFSRVKQSALQFTRKHQFSIFCIESLIQPNLRLEFSHKVLSVIRSRGALKAPRAIKVLFGGTSRSLLDIQRRSLGPSYGGRSCAFRKRHREVVCTE